MIEHSYITGKVKVGSSPAHGKGVLATGKIKQGEIIAVWGGSIVTQGEFDRLSKGRFGKIADYATRVADGFYLVSSKNGRLEDDDFFNHSCNPNAGIKGHLLMVAMRDIKPGEEVTYDYAMTDADFDCSFACNCGAAGCRKNITTDDWRNPALQKRYKGFFSWYVQEKIGAVKGRKQAAG